jgi:hypothetical protein
MLTNQNPIVALLFLAVLCALILSPVLSFSSSSKAQFSRIRSKPTIMFPMNRQLTRETALAAKVSKVEEAGTIKTGGGDDGEIEIPYKGLVGAQEGRLFDKALEVFIFGLSSLYLELCLLPHHSTTYIYPPCSTYPANTITLHLLVSALMLLCRLSTR